MFLGLRGEANVFTLYDPTELLKWSDKNLF